MPVVEELTYVVTSNLAKPSCCFFHVSGCFIRNGWNAFRSYKFGGGFFCRGEKERKLVVGRGKEERGCVTPVFWVILWLKRCGFV